MTTDGTAVAVRGLTKTWRGAEGPVRAVDGVDLDLRRGEVTAVLGPNGAGKTTMLDIVLGLAEPSGGSVEVLGTSPRRAVAEGRVAALLQTGGLLRDLTVRETVELVASTFAEHEPVDAVLERADLTAQARRLVGRCSGGEQQRLKFALALLPDPELVILDEPTTGMDVTARHAFWDTMHDDAAAGRTVVFATHHLEEVDAFADRVVVLARGRVVADGTTDEVRARANGRTVSATVPNDRLAHVADRLRTVPGTARVTTQGSRVVAVGRDSDAIARALLTELGGRDLEIGSGSLDEAFTTITEETR